MFIYFHRTFHDRWIVVTIIHFNKPYALDPSHAVIPNFNIVHVSSGGSTEAKFQISHKHININKLFIYQFLPKIRIKVRITLFNM